MLHLPFKRILPNKTPQDSPETSSSLNKMSTYLHTPPYQAWMLENWLPGSFGKPRFRERWCLFRPIRSDCRSTHLIVPYQLVVDALWQQDSESRGQLQGMNLWRSFPSASTLHSHILPPIRCWMLTGGGRGSRPPLNTSVSTPNSILQIQIVAAHLTDKSHLHNTKKRAGTEGMATYFKTLYSPKRTGIRQNLEQHRKQSNLASPSLLLIKRASIKTLHHPDTIPPFPLYSFAIAAAFFSGCG